MVLAVISTPGTGGRLLGHFFPPAGNRDVEPAGTAEHPYSMAICRMGGTGSFLSPPETRSDAWHPAVPNKVSPRPGGTTSPPALSVPSTQMPPG